MKIIVSYKEGYTFMILDLYTLLYRLHLIKIAQLIPKQVHTFHGSFVFRFNQKDGAIQYRFLFN